MRTQSNKRLTLKTKAADPSPVEIGGFRKPLRRTPMEIPSDEVRSNAKHDY